MRKVNSDDYKFLKIVDAITAVNQRVSIMGIIVEYSAPMRSRGPDWFCSLRIVDETHHSCGLLVNMFAEAKEMLPQVESSGDIIQLNSVTMRTHKTEVFALFNKRLSSSFALYEGKYGEGCKPYQSSVKFRQRQQGLPLIVGLRKWVDGIQLDTASKDSVLLRQLEEGQCSALVCKIIHVAEVSKDELMLFVWDGSDAPPLHFQSELENERESALPLQVEAQPLRRDILCKFPTVGTTLRVSVQQNVNLNVPSLTAGKWVKFINMAFVVNQGLWCGLVTPETKVRFVPSDDRFILDRQRDFEMRFSSNVSRMPFTSFPWPCRITELGSKLEDVPLLTLMDILTHTQVTAKFKCVARTVAALPCKVEDFRSPTGIYRVRLTLEDPTARIHAYLYADDAEVFFEGYPPTDVLTRKWNALLGIAEADSGSVTEVAPRNPQWVVFCIKSYYIDKNDVWGSRKFRVFNTKLVC